MRGKILILGWCVCLLASCGDGCGRYTTGGSAVAITVEQVKMQESSPIVAVPGVLQPRDRIEIRIPYPAKIAEVFVNKGDRVTQGMQLLTLTDEEINLKLNQLRSAKRELELTLEKNTATLKNRDRLQEEGRIDRAQYEAAEIDVAANEAALNKIKAELAIAEYNAAHIQINSPINGIVVEKYASPMQVAAESQVLFIIVNTDPILVSFPITVEESGGVQIGTSVNIKIDDLDNAEYKATISYIAPEIHQPGKTFEVFAAIPNSDYILKAGMQVTAEFTSSLTHKVFVVPETAVFSRDRDRFVYIVSGGVAHQTRVRVRNMHDGIAEIESGLAENDLVVAKGAQNLTDGASVEMWRR